MFWNKCDILNFNLIITFCGYVAVRGELVFNVNKMVHLGKDSLWFTCSVNPSVQVDQLYYIQFSRLRYNKWNDILLLKPDGSSFKLVWYDTSFEERVITNTSQTETGILWLNIPVEKVLHNDSGTYRCIASWLPVGSLPLTSNATKTVEVVELSSVPPTSTTDPNTDSSYGSSISETSVELTAAGYTTTVSSSNISQSSQEQENSTKELSSVPPSSSTTEPYTVPSYGSSISGTSVELTEPGYTTTVIGSNASQSSQGEEENTKELSSFSPTSTTDPYTDSSYGSSILETSVELTEPGYTTTVIPSNTSQSSQVEEENTKEFSSVPPTLTTDPYTDSSYGSSVSETSVELTEPGYTTTISGANASQSSQGQEENTKDELILGLGLGLPLAIIATILLILMYYLRRRKQRKAPSERNSCSQARSETGLCTQARLESNSCTQARSEPDGCDIPLSTYDNGQLGSRTHFDTQNWPDREPEGPLQADVVPGAMDHSTFQTLPIENLHDNILMENEHDLLFDDMDHIKETQKRHSHV